MTTLRTIGPYEILQPIGRGGMAEVYQAIDSRWEVPRFVALKILAPHVVGDPHAVVRFTREIDIAARLQHPNIVTLHDRGEHEGRPYFVMEYVDGGDLRSVIADRSGRGLPERLELLAQVADALDYAHARDIVHRDVKPANILLARLGPSEVVKLIDFGVVRIADSTLTMAYSQPGTASYMSPEQLESRSVDHRSDLFSLGIVIHEVLTGAHPFHADNDWTIAARIVRDAPPPPSSMNASVPRDVDACVLRLLEKQPDRRPRRAGEVAEALRAASRASEATPTAVATDGGEDGGLDALVGRAVNDLVEMAGRRLDEGALAEGGDILRRALALRDDPHTRGRLVEIDRQIALQARARSVAAEAVPAEAPAPRAGAPPVPAARSSPGSEGRRTSKRSRVGVLAAAALAVLALTLILWSRACS